MSDDLKNAVVEAARKVKRVVDAGNFDTDEGCDTFDALCVALAALDAAQSRPREVETVRVAKMVQIAVCQSDNDGSGCLYALMDDGRFFSRRPASDAPWQEQSTPTSLATLPLDPETDEIVERALAALRAELAAVREALALAGIWHEEQEKALSKQPPSGAITWRRLGHREQSDAIRAALGDTP